MRLVAAAALALAASAAVAPVSAQDWNATTAATQGGHRLGNPQADARLIAFVSYSCPHCGTFEKQADAPLRLAYVQSGKVSFEIRHRIHNPVDMAAALLTECGDDKKFFQNHRAIFGKQDDWLAKARSLSSAQTQRWNTGTIPARVRAIAGDLGFYDIMERRGYTRTQLDRCLGDEAKANALIAQMQTDNAKWDIHGTPSFVLDGVLLEGVHTWGQLKPALDKAVE